LIRAIFNTLIGTLNFGLLVNRITATRVIVTMNIMMIMLRIDFFIRTFNSILFVYIMDIIYHVLR
jgi:hypothetical protein